MPEKGLRAGAGTVRAGLEDDHEVSGLCDRQLHPIGQQVERCAQGSDDRRNLAFIGRQPIANGHRIVLAKHLAEVARRREMMIETAVGHQKYLSARDLPVDDPGDVDAGLADQIAAELDDQRGPG